MTDMQMNVDDYNLSKEFGSTFGYNKTPVAYNSMQDLKDCMYLGGKANT